MKKKHVIRNMAQSPPVTHELDVQQVLITNLMPEAMGQVSYQGLLHLLAQGLYMTVSVGFRHMYCKIMPRNIKTTVNSLLQEGLNWD